MVNDGRLVNFSDTEGGIGNGSKVGLFATFVLKLFNADDCNVSDESIDILRSLELKQFGGFSISGKKDIIGAASTNTSSSSSSSSSLVLLLLLTWQPLLSLSVQSSFGDKSDMELHSSCSIIEELMTLLFLSFRKLCAERGVVMRVFTLLPI